MNCHIYAQSYRLAETSELILVRGPLDGVGLAWPLVP